MPKRSSFGAGGQAMIELKSPIRLVLGAVELPAADLRLQADVAVEVLLHLGEVVQSSGSTAAS